MLGNYSWEHGLVDGAATCAAFALHLCCTLTICLARQWARIALDGPEVATMFNLQAGLKLGAH